MLRQIYIDRFNKIVSAFKPEIFGTLRVLDNRPYNQTVQQYLVADDQNQYYQLYLTERPLQPILNEIPFIQRAPKLLLFPTERHSIIVEEHIDENLYQSLLAAQSNQNYGNLNGEREVQARHILKSIRTSLNNYIEHNIDYNAIHPKNIVRINIDWQLSLSGLLLRNEKESDDYYKSGISKSGSYSYALGTLLFKLLFGFAPFERKKEVYKFSFKEYPKYLDRQQNKKFLKVYCFAQGMLEVSPLAKKLIEEALTGIMTLQDFYHHKYFEEGALNGVGKKEINSSNKQIKMLSLFDQAHQSLILAAVEHRKKYPHQRLNPKLLFTHQLNKQEIIDHLKKHPILCEIQFDERFRQQKVKGGLKQEENVIPLPKILYFYNQDGFDKETDFPCRDLIRLIESQKQSSKIHDQQNEEYQSRVKLYAFPYAVVFELFKVFQDQPIEIQRKILKFSEDLLQVSQLNYFPKIEPLHATQLAIKSFQEIKVRFREQLNELYKYFLEQAIRKYNVKKDLVIYSERANSKKIGLQYYKLCLKLLECSVINRKKGRSLDLLRIETSTRKQVESDLNLLLKQYFPNKIQGF